MGIYGTMGLVITAILILLIFDIVRTRKIIRRLLALLEHGPMNKVQIRDLYRIKFGNSPAHLYVALEIAVDNGLVARDRQGYFIKHHTSQVQTSA